MSTSLRLVIRVEGLFLYFFLRWLEIVFKHAFVLIYVVSVTPTFFTLQSIHIRVVPFININIAICCWVSYDFLGIFIIVTAFYFIFVDVWLWCNILKSWLQLSPNHDVLLDKLHFSWSGLLCWIFRLIMILIWRSSYIFSWLVNPKGFMIAIN